MGQGVIACYVFNEFTRCLDIYCPLVSRFLKSSLCILIVLCIVPNFKWVFGVMENSDIKRLKTKNPVLGRMYLKMF